MSKQINPARLGIFVLVAVGLGLGTLAVLSSGSLFKKTLDYVMVFDGDARGLKTGAPVLLKGVAVGQVTQIQLVVDTLKKQTVVPVTVSLDPSRLVYIGNMSPEASIDAAIAEGMRAQLQTQSFVTGMLEINLLRMPETEPVFRAVDGKLPEIPTVPPLTRILADELKDLNLRDILKDFRNTLSEINTLTLSLNKELPLLARDTLETSKSIRNLTEKAAGVLEHAESMMAELEKSAPGLLAGAEENSEKLKELQSVLMDTLKATESIIAQDSPLRYNAALALDRYTKVAAKLEQLLDALERNPESILTGKPLQD